MSINAMDNNLYIYAARLAVQFTEDSELPARFKRNKKKVGNKISRVVQDSMVEANFQTKVMQWLNFLCYLDESLPSDIFRRVINISPINRTGIVSVPKNPDWKALNELLIIIKEEQPDNYLFIGYLSMLIGANQRVIERSIGINDNSTAIEFVALDVETANSKKVSVCAIGAVKVIDGSIVDEFHSLIKPPDGEEFEYLFHTMKHGIRQKDVDDALSFKLVWENSLSAFIANRLLVIHNKSSDISSLTALFEYYSIDVHSLRYIDTQQVARRMQLEQSLSALCYHFNIHHDNVHNPLEDAKACARVFLKMIDIDVNVLDMVEDIGTKKKQISFWNPTEADYKKCDEVIAAYSIDEGAFSLSEISGKRFLITGQLSIDRDSASDFIKQNGGIIKPGVSNAIDYVIVGDGYGTEKIMKILDQNVRGSSKIKFVPGATFENLFRS